MLSAKHGGGMADTRIELERVCAARERIVAAGYDKDQVLCAFDGITSLLLTVLEEVRELKESYSDA